MDRRDELFDLLASTAEVDPPPALDRWVKLRLTDRPGAAPALLRPALAISLAAAGLLAFGFAFAAALAEAGAAEQGPLIATTLIWIYLAFSSTATLPILLCRRSGGAER